MIALSIVVIFSISCSKDTDLLADYVVTSYTDDQMLESLVSNDHYFITNSKSIVLDVLANDTFVNQDKIKIVDISQPSTGTVIINNDKTLTYFPDSTDAPEITDNKELNSTNENTVNSTSEEEGKTGEINEDEEKATNQTPDDIDVVDEPEYKQVEAPTEEKDLTISPIKEEVQQDKDDIKIESEDFTYSVETTDSDGSKTTHEATVTVTTEMGSLKAFPDVQGFGRDTKGGRGGIVYHVTNLTNSGPGSLRHGIQNINGPRTIVFDISGYIDLTGSCSIRNPFITIAGETAPKGGITLKNGGLIVRTSEVIVRHLSIRPGSGSAKGTDCISILAKTDNHSIKNVVFDHLSLSWSRDENIGINSVDGKNCSISNITIQNCLIAEPLKNYGILVGRNASNLSIIQNLWANVPNRIPETTYGHTGESFEFINNIIYNYSRPTTIVHGTDVDIIGNAYKLGIKQPAQTNMRYQSGDYSPDPSEGNLYAFDNIQIGKPNQLGFKGQTWRTWEKSSKVMKESTCKAISASKLESTILTDVGAKKSNDAVDSRILREYRDGTGIIGPKNENLVGGYPHIETNIRHTKYDTDKDGISDEWEKENGLDPLNYIDGSKKFGAEGYTNLERFLYSLTRS